MKVIFSALILFALLVLPISITAQKGSHVEIKQLQGPQNPRLGFVIHGGAGVIKRGSMTPEREKEYKAKLEEALVAGYKALQSGKSSLDAVEIAIRMLEDSPLFNAGKGAVFTADGKNELDASIMNGKTLAAGAVAGLHHVKNPITLARAVMEKSPHVMMVGDGAERFAKEQGIELVDETYFWTQEGWDSLQAILKQEKEKAAETPKPKVSSQTNLAELPYNKVLTVGAVVLDTRVNLESRSSTRVLTFKQYARAGDGSIMGAGTYANYVICAVSRTA